MNLYINKQIFTPNYENSQEIIFRVHDSQGYSQKCSVVMIHIHTQGMINTPRFGQELLSSYQTYGAADIYVSTVFNLNCRRLWGSPKQHVHNGRA